MISLRAARVNAELSIEEAGKLIGVHPNTVMNWETKRTKVKEYAKPKISEVYQLPIEMIKW